MTDKKSSEKIILKPWSFKEMSKLKDDFFSMICFASRKSGKSELIKYIFNKLNLINEYDYFIVMSECDDSIDFMSEICPGNLFFNKFRPEVIQKTIQQSQIMESNGRKAKFLCIIDDVVGNMIKHSEWITKLYATGRHYRMSCILISQQLTLISVPVRNNSDVILIGRTKTAQERNSVIDNILDGTADDDEIEQIGFNSGQSFYKSLIKYGTEDYNFIVLDYIGSKKNDFESIVRQIKAKVKK